jgi:hypothetical protein
MQRGTKMVDPSSGDLEWERDDHSRSRHDSYLRCIKARLGSYVGATENPGLVEPPGEIIAHKCTGIDGSKLCSQVLCKKSQTCTFT